MWYHTGFDFSIPSLCPDVENNILNNFSSTIATVNGTGSQTANLAILRAQLDGLPLMAQQVMGFYKGWLWTSQISCNLASSLAELRLIRLVAYPEAIFEVITLQNFLAHVGG